MQTSVFLSTLALPTIEIGKCAFSNFLPEVSHHQSVISQPLSQCWLIGSIKHHSNDVIMSAMVSQITVVSIVCSTVRSGTDQRNTKAPRHWPLLGELVTGGFPSQRASNTECFHVMTSSCSTGVFRYPILFQTCVQLEKSTLFYWNMYAAL